VRLEAEFVASKAPLVGHPASRNVSALPLSRHQTSHWPSIVRQRDREAGSFAEAIEFLQLAAQRAMARFAHIDAVAHLKAALALVAGLGGGGSFASILACLQHVQLRAISEMPIVEPRRV
jgi:hypothetical protein